jgi:hypothetical protein
VSSFNNIIENQKDAAIRLAIRYVQLARTASEGSQAMMLRFIISVLFFFPFVGVAQRMLQPEVQVISILGKQGFIPGEVVVLNGDILQCSELKMYLGSFSLLKSGKTVAQWPLDYFLVDFSDDATRNSIACFN